MDNADHSNGRAKTAPAPGQSGSEEPPVPGASEKEAVSFSEVCSDDQMLRNLSRLEPLAYERIRLLAAKHLGVRVARLDSLVKTLRKQLNKNEAEGGAGSELEFEDVEPWPTAVSGAVLLDAVYALLSRYVIADPVTLRTATLWVVLTWFTDYATVLPLALITAPEKGCGKSTLLNAMAKLVYRPQPVANITAAALFRFVEKYQPTLLIDEADTFMRDNPELTGMINAGHTRDSAYAIRAVGDNFEPKRFSTWGAKAISGISARGLSEALTSRSVVLTMRRKLPGETCENLRHSKQAPFDQVKRQLARWPMDQGDTFANLRPTLEGLNNRLADNWEPLLALADLAGGAWPQLVRDMVLMLVQSNDEPPGFNEELLGDIQYAFERAGVDRLSSADLILELCKDDESIWPTYHRGQPITPRQLARKLEGFGIKPVDIRFGKSNRKGYILQHFADAFTRYLPARPDLSATALQTSADKASGDISIRNASADVADKKTLGLGIGGTCSAVADKKKETGEKCESGIENGLLTHDVTGDKIPPAAGDDDWEVII
ncbi:DUF3631 domain-containing protein [Silvimonas amylolytica]|uniref:DUF3631 domain-containing protein n=1 Tax=Silvimonas amylolytica TaxID=449663 RepID=A0ABQ2PS57_9NEIS|nr:DUF3631 domain-containing protein [Silvimonas amylolytica]GGP28315.1 hypothetical protein GCM10010971_41340 [Silvimonas amylolytica]